jgi:hypothetical protein
MGGLVAVALFTGVEVAFILLLDVKGNLSGCLGLVDWQLDSIKPVSAKQASVMVFLIVCIMVMFGKWLSIQVYWGSAGGEEAGVCVRMGVGLGGTAFCS